MTHLSAQSMARVAQAYEQRLTPVLFEPWAQRIADQADLQPGQRVLDVACGTGVLARAVADRVGEEGEVSGVDLNPGMVAVARRTTPWIDWREGAAEQLPFEDGVFDAVVSQFGLMLFADPETALREMRRVSKPGGRLVVSVFGSLDDVPAYAAMAAAYDRAVGVGVGSVLRSPFSMGNQEALTELFRTAGLGSVVIERQEERVRFNSVADMVLADVRGWFPFAGIELDEATIDAVVSEAEQALAPFCTADGAVDFQVRAYIAKVN